MKIQHSILFLILFLAATCGKDDIKPIDKLPPATTEGKNTFGCLVNGEAWVAHIEDNPILFGERVVDAQYDDEDYLRIVAERDIESQNINQTLFLHCSVIRIDSSFFRKNCKLRDYNDHCDEFEMDTLSSYNLIINRLDTENKIISGLFNFTVIAADCNDTLQITDGRFDVKYHY